MTDATDALERAVADACLGETAGEELANDLRAFLEARGVAPDDVEAIVEAPRGLAIYRSLVRNGLARVVVRMLPRTRARMNALCAGRFDADLTRFLDEVGPRTHYLRDVPRELFVWAKPRWESEASVPRYLPDLASHELACFAVAAAEAPDPVGALADVTVDRPVVFTGSARRLHYGSAVHELSSDEAALDEPASRDVHLLAYRDADHAVRWLELTPLAASIVDALVDGRTLGAAVTGACAAHETTAQEVGIAVARLLADLGERGVLLGAPTPR